VCTGRVRTSIRDPRPLRLLGRPQLLLLSPESVVAVVPLAIGKTTRPVGGALSRRIGGLAHGERVSTETAIAGGALRCLAGSGSNGQKNANDIGRTERAPTAAPLGCAVVCAATGLLTWTWALCAEKKAAKRKQSFDDLDRKKCPASSPDPTGKPCGTQGYRSA
jgi:hypothetical protein